MDPTTNNWPQRRIKRRFYADISQHGTKNVKTHSRKEVVKKRPWGIFREMVYKQQILLS
jgi:hypothetical protein